MDSLSFASPCLRDGESTRSYCKGHDSSHRTSRRALNRAFLFRTQWIARGVSGSLCVDPRIRRPGHVLAARWKIFSSHGEILTMVGRKYLESFIAVALCERNSVGLMFVVAISSTGWGMVDYFFAPPQWLSIAVIIALVTASPMILKSTCSSYGILSSISGLPVTRLQRILRFLLSRRAYSLYIGPIIAEIQAEYFDAVSGGNRRYARQIIFRGYLMLILNIAYVIFAHRPVSPHPGTSSNP